MKAYKECKSHFKECKSHFTIDMIYERSRYVLVYLPSAHGL